MLLSNANYSTVGGQGGGGGGAGGMAGGGPPGEWDQLDAFGRVSQYGGQVGRTFSDLPVTPPMNLLSSPILLPHNHLPHPSFTTSIQSGFSTSPGSLVRPPITPASSYSPSPRVTVKRPAALVNQINACLSDILWAGDKATLENVLDKLEGLDAGLGRDVRSSAGTAYEAGRLVEYIRGVMRLVTMGVEGRGRCSYLAWEVEKLIAPIESIIDELHRLRGSAIISTFPILAAVKYIEANALGLSLDIREISMNRLVSHDAKILTLRDVISDLRSRVEHYYDDLLLTHSSTSPPLLSTLRLPNTHGTNALGLDHGEADELAFDEQIGSLFKMLASNSVQHIEHAAASVPRKEEAMGRGGEMKTKTRDGDGGTEGEDVKVHTGHSSSDEDGEDGEDVETIVV